MDIREHIALHLLEAHEGNNWTEVDITSTLNDITVEEATTVTKASKNTIAAMVHHITYWNRIMVERINGFGREISVSNGFDIPKNLQASDWQYLKDDNLASAQELASAIRSFDVLKMDQPLVEGHTIAYRNLQGSVEHVHYHLGQIVMIKHLLRSTVKQ